jgi:hypothetical protein
MAFVTEMNCCINTKLAPVETSLMYSAIAEFSSSLLSYSKAICSSFGGFNNRLVLVSATASVVCRVSILIILCDMMF